MPEYKLGGEAYPYEMEIAIRGALFPHFIIGIHDLNHENFLVNPHLLITAKINMHKIPTEGFEINQDSFEKEIKKTNYKRHLWLTPTGDYLDGY